MTVHQKVAPISTKESEVNITNSNGTNYVGEEAEAKEVRRYTFNHDLTKKVWFEI